MAICQEDTLHLNRALGSWVWDVAYYAADPTELLQFCEENRITELYLAIVDAVPDMHYVNLIRQLHEIRVQVAALCGDAQWIYPERRVTYDTFIRRVDAIQQLCGKGPRFYGLHLDANPHTLPEARENNMKDQVEPYISLIQDARRKADTRRLKLEWDMPSWFHILDDPTHKCSLAKTVFSLCDSVNVLTFRDRAEDQFNALLPNLEFAKELKKSLRICFETLSMDESRRKDGNSVVTYYEEGRRFMYQSLYQLQAMTKERYKKFGFAIHDIKRWAQMQQEPLPQYADGVPAMEEEAMRAVI